MPPRRIERPVPRVSVNQAEAAAAVGVSLSTFKRHFTPHIDCAYIGGTRLYLVEDLAAFVRLHRSARGS